MNTEKPKTFAERFREFDPNRPDNKPWATYVEMRNPSFKMHARRAQALQAIASWSDLAAIYFFEDRLREWVTAGVKDREKADCRCDLCHRTTIEYAANMRYSYALISRRLDEARYGKDAWDTGTYEWRRKAKKIAEPLELVYVCQQCRRMLRA